MNSVTLCAVNGFKIANEFDYLNWIKTIASSENVKLGQLTYVFCDDAYLLEHNKKYLNHDTLTDIITFNYNENGFVSGDVFISTERVLDNALKFEVSFEEELRRVMSHGLLHLIGYDDKKDIDKAVMRQKELEKMEMFHVKQ